MAEGRRALLAVTQGDPAGIGPEIILKLWTQRERLGLPPFFVMGSVRGMQATARHLGLAVDVAGIGHASEAAGLFPRALPVLDHGLDADADPGTPRPATAAATIAAIREAVQAVQSHEADAVVTSPIAKSVLYAAGFQHPGHTEFLAELAAAGGAAPRPVMMIWSELLAVIPVTIHIPLASVATALTTDAIVETGLIAHRELAAKFGVPAPRVAVAGLNPHAGEDGAIGREDEDIVRPAVAALRAQGVDATGPWPADTMFHARARQAYDVALVMYHDQGLIPAKTLAFDEGVNVTLGLPFIRTSPDHGTAFDIAGRGMARPDSFLAAIRLAERMARRSSAAMAAPSAQRAAS